MERAALILRAAALVCALASPAYATVDGWPALYDVEGVADDDVLNIRADPGAASAIIGTLEPDARGVEVIEVTEDEAWGRVNTAETTGWVSLEFLARRPGQFAGQAPETARCFGTEPFWSLALAEGGATFETPDALPLDFTRRTLLLSHNRIDRVSAVYENDLGGFVATMRNATCSDGMSDRSYGWDVDVLLSIAGGDNAQMFSGCCSIAPE